MSDRVVLHYASRRRGRLAIGWHRPLPWYRRYWAAVQDFAFDPPPVRRVLGVAAKPLLAVAVLAGVAVVGYGPRRLLNEYRAYRLQERAGVVRPAEWEAEHTVPTDGWGRRRASDDSPWPRPERSRWDREGAPWRPEASGDSPSWRLGRDADPYRRAGG